MPCETILGPGGTIAIACTRGQRRAPCGEPGCDGSAHYACDYPLSGVMAGKTCDRPLCGGHARRQPGRNRHYCPAHAAGTRLPLGGTP
jgi:hypothetical protein